MEIKDGDILHWQYKDHDTYLESKRGSGTAYWCMDQQCFATKRSGVIYLIDTYWQDYDGKFIGNDAHVVSPEHADLTFVCNLNEIEFIQEYEAQDYEKYYNLSRQKGCYKKFAIDKGTQPSNSAILTKLQTQLVAAESAKSSAEWNVLNIKRQIEELNK